MKRGVVLSGGGTKGAYEVGVWRALRELNIDYQVVTGTSIGSINGAMMAMQDFERCEKMWLGMEMTDLMSQPQKKKFSFEEFLKKLISPGESMREQFGAGSVDNSPFPDFIRANIDEDMIRNSPVDYGLVTVRSHDRKPFLLTKKDIPQGLMHDYIIASSSVYPVFPMHKIGDENYIDGMYHDNLPIDLCISMGAGELVVVDLHQEPQHPAYESRPYVTYITPSEDLGGILAFDPKVIRKNIEMGYRDALRSFGRFKGYTYCILPESFQGFDAAVERFNVACAQGQGDINLYTRAKKKRVREYYQMYRLLEKYSRGRAVEKEDYFIRGAEIAADIVGLSHEKIWDMKDLIEQVKKHIGSPDASPDRRFFQGEVTKSFHKDAKRLEKEKGKEYIMGCLYHAFCEKMPNYDTMREILRALPGESAASLFLRSI